VGLDPAAGRAHGLAGTVEFLLTLASRTSDGLILAAAAERARQLAERTQVLLQQTRQLAAPPLAVSWCRGLSGIAPVLLLASTVLQDSSLARLARDATETCIAYLPRLNAPGRCCGIAGVGSFLIDLAINTQDERYWRAAERAGVQILLRSAGTPNHPIFPASPGHSSTGWAAGLAGLLSYFRRLTHRGEPDSIPLPSAQEFRQRYGPLV
jgi:lantibiotic modifying enzyme